MTSTHKISGGLLSPQVSVCLRGSRPVRRSGDPGTYHDPPRTWGRVTRVSCPRQSLRGPRDTGSGVRDNLPDSLPVPTTSTRVLGTDHVGPSGTGGRVEREGRLPLVEGCLWFQPYRLPSPPESSVPLLPTRVPSCCLNGVHRPDGPLGRLVHFPHSRGDDTPHVRLRLTRGRPYHFVPRVSGRGSLCDQMSSSEDQEENPDSSSCGHVSHRCTGPTPTNGDRPPCRSSSWSSLASSCR